MVYDSAALSDGVYVTAGVVAFIVRNPPASSASSPCWIAEQAEVALMEAKAQRFEESRMGPEELLLERRGQENETVRAKESVVVGLLIKGRIRSAVVEVRPT